jgi:broad specificity phosphatase PhoE
MKHVILLRHGETTHNAAGIIQGWQNPGLTENGKAQVREAARIIDKVPDVIIASDLRRAVESADVIRDELGYDTIPLLLDWRLRERRFGTLEGKPRDEAKSKVLFAAKPDESPFDAESENDLSRRVWSFIQSLNAVDGETIYVITHNGILNCFGYLLVPGYASVKYPNSHIVTYDIDPDTVINQWDKRKEAA